MAVAALDRRNSWRILSCASLITSVISMCLITSPLLDLMKSVYSVGLILTLSMCWLRWIWSSGHLNSFAFEERRDAKTRCFSPRCISFTSLRRQHPSLLLAPRRPHVAAARPLMPLLARCRRPPTVARPLTPLLAHRWFPRRRCPPAAVSHLPMLADAHHHYSLIDAHRPCSLVDATRFKCMTLLVIATILETYQYYSNLNLHTLKT
jgi:hypothetical protein